MLDAAHTCHVYESPDEAVEVAIRFLAEGLAAGERCAFVGPEATRETVGAALGATGAREGAVLLLADDTAFLTAGKLVPQDQGAALRDVAVAARRNGTRLRVAADTTRVLAASPSVPILVASAARVDAILREWGAIALCQYDRRALPAEIVCGAIRVHEHVIHRGRRLRNVHAVAPAALLQRETAEAEVERLLSSLLAREQAEDALRESEERLRIALESAGHMFWEYDVATGRVVSSASQLLLGHAPDRVRSADDWTSLIHPDDRERMLATLQAHVSGETPRYRCEYRARDAAGAWKWVLAAGRIRGGDDGRPRRMAGTVTDVTETHELRERLQSSDRLASVGTLAAGVAHEINNPLAFVIANLGHVREELGRIARGDEAARAAAIGALDEALRDALDGAARVRGIVQGLRQFAQPARDPKRGPLDAKGEIAAAVRLARNEIAHRATLALDLAEDLPPVLAAPHELAQIVVNLLVNAAQAIPEGRAAWNEIRVSARAVDGTLALEVRDTGEGIPADALPHIFDPFFTTKPVGSGTGLGLSICRGIVVALGGEIQVDTSSGHGTSVRVVLPAAAPAPAAAPPSPAAAVPSPPRRARVLVVDDEALVGRSLARLLEASHDVTTLASPAEVLARLAAGERWDVVLCDLMMPEMSGMDLEARIAEAAPEIVRRIVYMTGGAFTDRARAFLDAGRPCLEKPIDPAVLRARVAEVAAAPAPTA